jgi:hypothetical protein
MTAPRTVLTAMEVRAVRLRTSEHIAGSDAMTPNPTTPRRTWSCGPAQARSEDLDLSIVTADVRTYANLLLPSGSAVTIRSVPRPCDNESRILRLDHSLRSGRVPYPGFRSRC